MKISRRDLVKGGLAAPLVLTLRHASAQAQTSLSCLDKSMSQAQLTPPPKWSTTSDTWLRKTVRIYRLKEWNSNKKTWDDVAGGKYLFYQGKATPYLKLDAEFPRVTTSTLSDKTVGNTTQNGYIERQAIIYVDNHGAEVGFAWEQPAQSYVTSSSCAISTALRAR